MWFTHSVFQMLLYYLERKIITRKDKGVSCLYSFVFVFYNDLLGFVEVYDTPRVLEEEMRRWDGYITRNVSS